MTVDNFPIAIGYNLNIKINGYWYYQLSPVSQLATNIIINNSLYNIDEVDGDMNTTKSVLGRVRNCVGEQALHCEMVASSYVCQPNHSYAESMFRLHSDHTRGCVVAGVLHSV